MLTDLLLKTAHDYVSAELKTHKIHYNMYFGLMEYVEKLGGYEKYYDIVLELSDLIHDLWNNGGIWRFEEKAIKKLKAIVPGFVGSTDPIIHILISCITTRRLGMYNLTTPFQLVNWKHTPMECIEAFLRLLIMYHKGGISIVIKGVNVEISLLELPWTLEQVVVTECSVLQVPAEDTAAVMFNLDLAPVDMSSVVGSQLSVTDKFDSTLGVAMHIINDASLLHVHGKSRALGFDTFVPEVVEDVVRNHCESGIFDDVVQCHSLNGFVFSLSAEFVARIVEEYPEFDRDDCRIAFALAGSICGKSAVRRFYWLIRRLYNFFPCPRQDFWFNGHDYYDLFQQALCLFCDANWVLRIDRFLDQSMRAYHLNPLQGNVALRLAIFMRLSSYNMLDNPSPLIHGLMELGVFRPDGGYLLFQSDHEIRCAMRRIVGRSHDGPSLIDGLGIFVCYRSCKKSGVPYTLFPLPMRKSVWCFVRVMLHLNLVPVDVLKIIVDHLIRIYSVTRGFVGAKEVMNVGNWFPLGEQMRLSDIVES